MLILLTMEPWYFILLEGWWWVFLFMTILWLWHFPLRNAAIVDVGWTFSLVLLALFFYSKQPETGIRHLVFLLLVALWGLRLGLYLFFTRIWHSEEEGRYRQLRESWKTGIGMKFFIFFQAQALLDVLLATPFLLVMADARVDMGLWEYAGTAVWLLGWLGETIADLQLHFFKKKPANRGKICNVGLWRYSRHPNYFFEVLVWWGIALYALSSSWGWLGMVSPLLIMYFIFNVTGIPATEAQALRSKGEAYAEYQRTVNRFIPWFPKKQTM